MQRCNIISAVCIIGFAAPAFALAQDGSQPPLIAPDYGSGVSAGQLSEGNFNTPESDGRPGAKFFAYAVEAYRKGDYAHAVDMYKVAASWAYKPAEYNLGVMYFKGEGVPADRPLGAAWMVLAAERGTPRYVKTRDLMVTALTAAQFQRTDTLWNQLKPTYGDAVALQRAKAQWRRTLTAATGSHLGHAMGELRVGSQAPGPNLRPGPAVPSNPAGVGGGGPVTAADVLGGGSVDSTIAYHQLQQSANPYDPAFLKDRSGKATVGPLQSVKPSKREQPPAGEGGATGEKEPPPTSG